MLNIKEYSILLPTKCDFIFLFGQCVNVAPACLWHVRVCACVKGASGGGGRGMWQEAAFEPS